MVQLHYSVFFNPYHVKDPMNFTYRCWS